MSTLLGIGLANAALAMMLAVVAAGVGRVARHPALVHGLWLLVLLKLLSPPLMPVPIRWEWPARAGTAIDRGWALVRGGAPAAASAVKSPAIRPPRWLSAPSSRSRSSRAELTAAPALEASPPPARPALAAAPTLRPARAWGWSEVTPAVATVWLAGSTVWFLVAAVRIIRFHRLLRHAVPAPALLRVEAQVLAVRLGLPRGPDIDLLPVAVSPMLWGMAGPVRLILPADLLERLEPDERSALLTHELIHFRRRDHWVRWLELVALGLYWWHPAAWWARRELHRAEERCCDAGVVGSLPGMALAYAKALIKTLDFLSESRPIMAPSANTVGPVPSLKRRVTMILNQPVPRRPSWPSRLFAVVLGLLALPLAPRLIAAQDSGEKPSAPAASARDADRRTRELERKIEVLERKLDRLAKQLEAKAQRSERLAPRADRKSQREERKEERKTEHEPGKPRGEQRPAEAKPDGDADKAQIERDIEEVIEKTIDTEKLEALGEKIAEAVEKNIDTEKLEALGEKIAEAVEQSIHTEKLEQIGERIGKAFENGFDPKELEKLGKEIEQSVKESINTEKLEQLGKEIEAKLKTPGELKEKTPKADRLAPRPSRREQRALRREQRQERNLEQRLRTLEEKLDRLLKDSSSDEDEEE